jgi:hypothetical protein
MCIFEDLVLCWPRFSEEICAATLPLSFPQRCIKNRASHRLLDWWDEGEAKKISVSLHLPCNLVAKKYLFH